MIGKGAVIAALGQESVLQLVIRPKHDRRGRLQARRAEGLETTPAMAGPKTKPRPKAAPRMPRPRARSEGGVISAM